MLPAVSLVLLLLQVALPFSPIFEAAASEELLPEINEAEEKLQLAFNALNQANEVGASEIEVSELAQRLDTALTLLMEARAVRVGGNNSLAADYAFRSIAASDGVREEAEHLRAQTSEALSSSRVAVFALAPVVGFIAAVVFYYAFRARRPGMEKILRMGIRRKEERG